MDKVRVNGGQTREDLVPIDGRVPPNDQDAEAAVLSAVMVDPLAFDKVAEFLKPEHFYAERHRRIYEACVDLSVRGLPPDNVTIGNWLKDRDRLEQVGGMPYLSEILVAAPYAANVANYARIIQEKWRVRQLILACQRVTAQGYTGYGDASEFIDSAEQAVYDIARTPETTTVKSIKDVMRSAFERIDRAAKRGGRITGLATGFAAYDKMTSGLHDGDLTIVAARPGIGKTSLVLNIAINVASPQQFESADDPNERWTGPVQGVVVFSLEMPREQIANRMLCSEARVDVSKVRTGILNPSDWTNLTRAASHLSTLNLWIDDTSALSILELRSKVRRLQSEFNRPDPDNPGEWKQRIGLVVVDYLQLMKGREGAPSREQEISEISRGLKHLAKDLGVPVIALSQLNRSVENRGDKAKPRLSDLRESGAIEQDADNICFIYRDKDAADTRATELIVEKQRNGPTGIVKVSWDARCTRFDNLEEGDYETGLA